MRYDRDKSPELMERHLQIRKLWEALATSNCPRVDGLGNVFPAAAVLYAKEI
jgi:hypothetical protein